MFQQLDEVEGRYEELTSLMGDPDVAGDPERYREVAQQHAQLAETVEAWRSFKQVREDLASSRELLLDDDPEMREMARAEVEGLEERLGALETELKLLLLPRDPNDDRNVVLEIRAGTGGDEATLFAADLFRMYSRYAEGLRWNGEPLRGRRLQGGHRPRER